MPTIKEITVSAKGQIVIPAEMREALDLGPGDKLIVRQEGQRITLERRDAVLNALEGKYALPDRSFSAELHAERRTEASRK